MIGGGRHRIDRELVRIRVLIVFMLVAFAGLAAFLYQAQVANGAHQQTRLDSQSIRRVRLPGMRGRIYDRRGEVIADNRPSYGIAIYLEELRLLGAKGSTTKKVLTLLDQLEKVIGRPSTINEEATRIHLRKRKPLPLIAWRDLDVEALARFAENASTMPGVGIWTDGVRVYPNGKTACHVLGYVGRTNVVKDSKQPYNFHYPEMLGSSGIEKRLNSILRGRAGGRLIRVDVAGYRHEDLAIQEPLPGSDIKLSIDLRVQRLAEEALKGIEGSAVVVDPRNGEVLALASSPGFDPNAFVPYMTTDMWETIVAHPGRPLFNRSVAGTYTPGSIFKPIVAFAALENGKVSPEETYHCPGAFIVGRQRFSCWLKRGHGHVKAREAIQHSCNVYFFHVGLKMGYEYIYHMAGALGLGKKTGISTDFESSGVLADEAWKRARRNERWWDGDTCNMSIGQGPLTVTPIQMAMVTTAIANGGIVYKPLLVRGTRLPGEEKFDPVAPSIVNRMNWSRRSMQVVQGGMYDSVMTSDGTGRLAKVPGLEMAGKTGTAEYGPKTLGKKRGWMIAYAPFRQPRYVVAIVVDDATGGGIDAAPRVQSIMAGLIHISLPSPKKASHG